MCNAQLRKHSFSAVRIIVLSRAYLDTSYKVTLKQNEIKPNATLSSYAFNYGFIYSEIFPYLLKIMSKLSAMSSGSSTVKGSGLLI